jgi:hypothetical protein
MPLAARMEVGAGVHLSHLAQHAQLKTASRMKITNTAKILNQMKQGRFSGGWL